MKGLTVLALSGILACGGGGGDAASGGSGACVSCLPTAPPPPVNTKDTITLVFAPADSFDISPVGISADFVSSDSVSTPITVWYSPVVAVVPKGASGKLKLRGGTKYEDRVWDVNAAAHAESRAVLTPKTWIIRGGDFGGQSVSISRDQSLAPPGNGDVYNFFFRWTNAVVMAPWGVPDSDLPLTVSLANPYDAGGNWTAADSTLVATQVDRTNSTWGRKVLVMGPNSTDTLPSAGTLKVARKADNASGNYGGPTLFSATGDISGGRIVMAKDGWVGASNLGNVSHEFIHVLGFGHTCGWVTWMRTGACQSQFSPTNWFTASDIAGFQLAYAIRSQSKRINANLSFF